MVEAAVGPSPIFSLTVFAILMEYDWVRGGCSLGVPVPLGSLLGHQLTLHRPGVHCQTAAYLSPRSAFGSPAGEGQVFDEQQSCQSLNGGLT
eukprot:948669-Pelagomonas_calceolata.AAC.1